MRCLLFLNCALMAIILFFARFSNASPVLSLELEPSVIGVEVEDRIANPASASSASSSVSAAASSSVVVSAASSSSGGSILDDLVPSIIGVEVEDRIANPASSSASASSSSGVGSIGDIFAPDVTSVDVKDEERAHRDDAAEEEDKHDGCVGEGCVCPPGTKGVQPFCIPIAPATATVAPVDDYEGDEEIPMDFYEKIAGLKSVEQFINLTKIDVGFVVRQGQASLTTLPAEGCIPKKKCVSVRPKNRHPSEDVFPSSVDVERCGGCCGHPDLTCLPWSTEPTTVKLLKYGYNPDGTLTHLGFITTSVIREVKCKCVKVQS